MTELEMRAKKMSEEFIETEKEYRLGFVEAEKSNPKTAALGETFVRDTKSGVRMLLSVDMDLYELFKNTICGSCFDEFVDDAVRVLKSGGRIVISGCGSSGRLAMRIAASWRIAAAQTGEENPEAKKYANSVDSLMTGGDYAIIRAVESFEDYISLGEMQAAELHLGENDMLIGVTATAETTSVLGTAIRALKDGAKAWMVVCTKPESIMGKLKRADDLYTHKNCKSLYMNCGGMAVTGSTRMQSSTIEQAVIGAALEMALDEIVTGKRTDKNYLADGFKACLDLISCRESVEGMAKQVDKEASLYENGGYVTYFADEYLLDVLSDTTERGPTFSVPAFRPQSRKDLPLSLAFVKNPLCDTETAWYKCFERVPSCIDKTADEYKSVGIKSEDIKRIPKINLAALYEYRIGNEPDEERECGNSLATWIGFDGNVPQEFYKAAQKYKDSSVFTVNCADKKVYHTRLKLFEHIAAKLTVNNFSTGTMAKLGRIKGNYMVYVSISNKKLVDRATRIISDLCGISYEEANYQLFLTKLTLEGSSVVGREAIETIERINGGK